MRRRPRRSTKRRRTVPFVELVAQYESIAEEIDESVSFGHRVGGVHPRKTRGGFEKEFAKFVEAEHGVGVGAGSTPSDWACWRSRSAGATR